MASFVKGLRCRECGRTYGEEPTHVCEYCFGPLEVHYDYDALARVVSRDRIQSGPANMWRYKDFLPVSENRVADINDGFTPLLKATNLGRVLGLDNLYLKNDTVNPTFSFKDRPVSVAIAKAAEFGFDTIACASTGNLACSVAAHAAKAAMKAYVFVPADLERSKIVGAAIYEPIVVAIDGNYDEVNRLCTEVADAYGWAFVNINVRPYYSEGSKTLAYEVAEQLGWRAPDHAIVPIASGSLFTKIWKGYKEMERVGLIGPVRTKMTGAQAAGCGPVADAFAANSLTISPVKPNTIAKSLAIGNPADGYYCLKIMQETGGYAIGVTDQEVIDGIRDLAKYEGVFAETAGGVTVAVLRRLARSGKLHRDEVVVAYITGNGYKTQEAVIDHVVSPIRIAPTLRSFEDALEALKACVPR